MIIHVVKEGETAGSIANAYGITEDRLILENDIKSPNDLAIGETLVILLPETTYIVQEGDTLGGIADQFGVTVMQLLRNNPYLSDRDRLYVGESLVITYATDKLGSVAIDGYAYPFIDRNTLKKTLPYLTHLTIYSYKLTEDGELITIHDTELIEYAKYYGVAPIMMVTSLGTTGSEETSVFHAVLSDKEKQTIVINQVLDLLQQKGYHGVNINTPYILPEDRASYVEFISNFSKRIKEAGFHVAVSFSLSAFELLTGTIYEGLEYKKIGEYVDNTILISYEWASAVGVPSGIVSFDTLQHYISHILEFIPAQEVLIGMPSIGYLWELPYVAGVTKGMSINYNTAIQLAKEHNVPVQYDDNTESAFIHYITCNEYIARFRDARSVNSYASLVPNMGLSGLGIWNIMIFFPQMWLVINSQYEIVKI